MMSPRPADAAEPVRQTMLYDVYSGGFDVVDGKLLVESAGGDRKDGRYGFVFDARTRGLLAKLAPWSGTFETRGWQSGGTLKPELHRSVSRWKDEAETKTYSYNKDGSFAGYRRKDDKHDGQSPEEVDPALTSGTIDAFTQAMNIMIRAAQEKGCSGSADVFDGDRRFALLFKGGTETVLRRNRYNAYDGPAVACTMEIVPKGGRWHEKPRGWLSIQEQGRAKGSLPTIWFASVRDGAPAIPVKAEAKTDYGTMVMQLSAYESGKLRFGLKK